MENNREGIAKLKKMRNMMLLCALLVGGSTVLKMVGVFATGFFPVWLSGILVLGLIASAIHTSVKLRKLQ